MTSEQSEAVYKGALDFVEGAWLTLDKPSSRAKAARVRRGLSIEAVESGRSYSVVSIPDVEAGECDQWGKTHSIWYSLAREYGVLLGWLAGWEQCVECKHHIHPTTDVCVDNLDPANPGPAHEACSLKSEIRRLKSTLLQCEGEVFRLRGLVREIAQGVS